MNGDGRRFRASSSVRSLPYQENRLNRRVRLRVYNKLPREVQVADGKLSTTKENNPRERSQTPSHLNARLKKTLYVFYTNRHDFIRCIIIDSLYCARNNFMIVLYASHYETNVSRRNNDAVPNNYFASL
ncbi:hypothetical protein ALC57_07146 [Trachymyrmex cornetzi]|uniref:Uncharacterized protein n=1 Tax=Trachymyrmex cornetzi TaxID=471704 RepID=A0A195E5S6_9HYME|nr:hypothetical protein ALC57_07146 [Trachymyrmex cornetzi]